MNHKTPNGEQWINGKMNLWLYLIVIRNGLFVFTTLLIRTKFQITFALKYKVTWLIVYMINTLHFKIRMKFHWNQLVQYILRVDYHQEEMKFLSNAIIIYASNNLSINSKYSSICRMTKSLRIRILCFLLTMRVKLLKRKKISFRQ